MGDVLLLYGCHPVDVCREKNPIKLNNVYCSNKKFPKKSLINLSINIYQYFWSDITTTLNIKYITNLSVYSISVPIIYSIEFFLGKCKINLTLFTF